MTFPDQWGGKFLVGNTNYYASQPNAHMSVLRDGWIVTTWQDFATHTYKCQILNADGSTFGQAFDIGSPGAATRDPPSVAAMPDGRFIIVYTKNIQNTLTVVQETYDVFNGKVDSNDIYSHLVYSIDGLKPAICSFSDGSFYITYTK
jgi:hypothetical protein